MARKRKRKRSARRRKVKTKPRDPDLPEGYWVECGEAPEVGIGFIVGFTSGGMPFGLTYEELARL